MLSQIRELEKQGKITTQAHPSLPLIVCKYSREVMYSRDWDELTKKCRGLVVDVNTGEVVAEPFHKFFNYEELMQRGVPLNGSFRTMEKLDGSLICAFWYENNWILCSSGSFTSDQVMNAKHLWAGISIGLTDECKAYTWMFELIGPSNPHVVDYKQDQLVFLAARHNVSKELTFSFDAHKLPCAEYICKYGRAMELPELSSKSLKDIQDLDLDNQEGYVVVFDSGTMCKVKFKTYVLLHRMVHDFSTKNLIKSLRAGEDVIDDLVGFMHIDRVNNVVGLTHQIMILKKDTERLVKSIAENLHQVFDSRKQLAIFVLDNFKPIADAVFRAIDGKDIDSQVWDIVSNHVIKTN